LFNVLIQMYLPSFQPPCYSGRGVWRGGARAGHVRHRGRLLRQVPAPEQRPTGARQ